MNVIVSNKYKDLLNSLDFEISKNINGEFTADEIIESFSNFFFNRMFLDITAIKDYKNLENIQKLSINLDMSRVILFLDDDLECSSPEFLSKIISLGIYNFTRNKEGIIYLYNHPNIYRDVAHLHKINSFPQVNNNMGTVNSLNQKGSAQVKILGVKNLTSHAGATTFVNSLLKVLSQYYYTVAIEVNKRDFLFLKEENTFSTTSVDLRNTIASKSDADIILLDLNDVDESICTDVLYLIEPSTIKLNKLVLLDRNIFNKMMGKKIILNQSLLGNSDVSEFERESGVKVFYNIPPINDKIDNSSVFLPILGKLGYIQRVD